MQTLAARCLVRDIILEECEILWEAQGKVDESQLEKSVRQRIEEIAGSNTLWFAVLMRIAWFLIKVLLPIFLERKTKKERRKRKAKLIRADEF